MRLKLSSVFSFSLFFSLLVAVFFLFPLVAEAAEDPFAKGIPARNIALGDIFIALDGDAGSIFTNPARLSDLTRDNFISSYSQPIDDISFALVGVALADKLGGTLALGYRDLTTANIVFSAESSSYSERDISLVYSRFVEPELSMGLSLRFLSRQLSPNIAALDKLNGQGGMVDFGVKYQAYPWLSYGLALRSLGGRMVYNGGKVEELSTNLIGGAAVRVLGESAFWPGRDRGELLACFDLNKNFDEPLPQFHFGLEYQPQPAFFLRCGLDQTPSSRQDNYTHPTAGFGFHYQGITFDYAYKQWQDGTGNVSQYLSIGYVGYDPPSAPVQTRPVRQEDFSDVPKGYWAKEPIEALTALGVMDYYPDGSFYPERPVSRADTVKMMVTAKKWGLPDDLRQIFADVTTDFWGAKYIQAAYDNKLIKGYPDGLFRPRQSTSRREGVVLISRFDELELPGVEILPFPDLKRDDWSLREVVSVQQEGILDYLSGQELRGSLELTRAELAELFYRTRLIKEELRDKGLLAD